MVLTTEALPALPLRDFISSYCLREIDTNGTDLVKAIHAIDQSFMTFWISKTPLLYTTGKGVENLNIKERQLLCIPSRFQGYQTYNGRYSFFSVNLKANGFYRIFNVPMQLLSDSVVNSDDVIGKEVSFLQEQLEESANLQEMKAAADAFFLSKLIRNTTSGTGDRITAAALAINASPESLNVRQLASSVNMSLRALEQHFLAQVGMPPKLYARVSRFMRAMGMKMSDANIHWTTIAHSCGYFDQMHLVKDFKAFTGQSPRAFMQGSPPPAELFGPVLE
ncbi:AraC family transcriptional regulator [Chitinophaga sp. Cy-1792]|uniref:helix-turn-helix domain-containing protein n=1 Tax=Chitinophaga sp. Cy-1792 TaxID=2608339 RepID=UPI00141E105F|nr:helix-turn-helix domain-containing protein [Chitinophaga sp. Cy-1792]NIG54270.1 AraC family transcriptional regulator [Chitinophaga sp. Cy-1792]